MFEAYDEPVDPAALARLHADLDAGPAQPAGLAGAAPAAAPRRAADRGPRQRGRRWARRHTLAATAAVLLALGGALLTVQLADRPGPAVAGASGSETTADSPVPEPDGPGRDAPDPSVAAASGSADVLAELPASRAQAETGLAVGRSSSGRAGRPGRAAGPGLAASPSVPERPPAPDLAASVDPRTSAETVGPRPSTGTSDPDRDAGAAPEPERSARSAPGVFEPLTAASSPPAAPAGQGPEEDPLPLRPVDTRVRAELDGGVRVVVATTSAFSGGQRAGGGGVSAGLARDWRVGRGVSITGGAAASYSRLTVDPGGLTPTQAFQAVAQDPSADVDVTTESTLTTFAVEVPVDVTIDLARSRRGRLGVSVGLTSAVYLAQTFEDEKQRVSGEVVRDAAAGDVALSSKPFAVRETAGPLGRIDLARQLNLALRLSGPGRHPLAGDVYARLPLAGLTSRDLPLTTVGVRLRVALP